MEVEFCQKSFLYLSNMITDHTSDEGLIAPYIWKKWHSAVGYNCCYSLLASLFLVLFCWGFLYLCSQLAHWPAVVLSCSALSGLSPAQWQPQALIRKMSFRSYFLEELGENLYRFLLICLIEVTSETNWVYQFLWNVINYWFHFIIIDSDCLFPLVWVLVFFILQGTGVFPLCY